MPLFRKKPVVIEATQFHKLGDHPAVVAAPESPTGFGIHTLEHVGIKHEVTPGDWIITGIQGEVYACKDDIFEATYEPAELTVVQWLERLPDGYRERAISQSLPRNINSPADDVVGALLQFRGWGQTNEGKDFWIAVYKHYRDGTSLPPLP